MTVDRPMPPPVPVPPYAGDPWMDEADCVGSWELFFPDHSDPGPAKRICGGCPVRGQCLAYALRAGERHGIWGGMTPGERRSHARLRFLGPQDEPEGST
ncbi:WhiB family transcriptional regulator [Spirillospora sp. CA-255316]